jgi:hypothetical protein
MRIEMEFFLDNERLDLPATPGGTLETILAEVNKLVFARQRSVVALGCDGRDIPTGEILDVLARPADDFQRVDFRSEANAGVARQLLQQAAERFEETEQGRSGIIDLLAEGQTVRGMELLAGSFRLWQQAHQAVLQAVRVGGIRLDDVQVDGEPSVGVIEELKDKLVQIKEALEARDFVMLGDIMQYEIGETVAKWKALIGRVEEALVADS